jgi:hypothetical protein
MKKIVNATPHAINIVGQEEIAPSGIIVRCSVTTEVIEQINGINITKSVFGEVQDLPDQTEDTIYIVSMLVASALPERKDLFFPNEQVRDESGKIVGCKSLAQI